MLTSIVIDTAPVQQQSPVPGLILISLGIFVWMLVRFARRNEILVRVAFGLLLLWLLALIAPRAAAFFKRRFDLAKAAVQGTPPAPREEPPVAWQEPTPRSAPRHRAEGPTVDTQPIPIITPEMQANYKGGR